MSSTSATGGYLIPAAGRGRQWLERLLRSVIAGCTGLDKKFVRARWLAEPANIPAKDVTWCSFGIAVRSVPETQVIHLQTQNSAAGGESRVAAFEDVDVQVSFFGPDAEDMLLLLRDALRLGQNREELYRANAAFTGAGPVSTMPELVRMGWRQRADCVFTFRKGPEPIDAPLARPVPGGGAGTAAIRHMAGADDVGLVVER